MTTTVSPENQGAIFSILIPSWNNLPYLQLCVESIRKNSACKHEIIVHVNAGTDGTIEWVKKQPDIIYTYSENNIGICYALNFAAARASTDYILYMNDDMYVCPQWDQHLLEEIRRVGHEYFFISATMIEREKNKAYRIFGNYGATVKDFQEDRLLKEYTTLAVNDWSGATWPPNVVHKAIWDSVGGYSIEFSPGMYSDPDFSMKLWKAGVRYFKGVGKSMVYHFGCVSTAKVKKNKGYYQFLIKWGITSSAFTRHFLKWGNPFNGLLAEPQLNFNTKMKSFFKFVVGYFKVI